MAEAMSNNPYRTDYPDECLFYGRAEERKRLCRALESGRNSLAAVMGGRGMGKTALALRIKQDLQQAGLDAVHYIAKPASDAGSFFAQLAQYLGQELDGMWPVESVVGAVRASRANRIVLLIEEPESVIANAAGRALLENLRAAWEQLRGKLGIVIFGGSMLRELLLSDTSPFLRSAQWMPLRGLSLEETAALLCDPLRLDMPDELVEALWVQTGGHPLLLQAIMECAVEHAASHDELVVNQIPAAMHDIARGRLEATLFPIWWDNLQARGQDAYHKLLQHGQPVPRTQQARVLGNGPQPWIEVLETTGVARIEGDMLYPRCEFFRIWAEENHPRASQAQPPNLPPLSLPFPWDHSFEETVITAIARWARDVIEFPAVALKGSSGNGNGTLLPEVYFQLQLLLALRQRELLVEPEPLSSTRGRTDLKIRWPREHDRRACIETKIWGRNHQAVVEQLLGYTLIDDAFACVVMIDRQARSLRTAYQSECLDGDKCGKILWQSHEEGNPLTFVTSHARDRGRPIRVYHFLVQLPGA